MIANQGRNGGEEDIPLALNLPFNIVLFFGHRLLRHLFGGSVCREGKRSVQMGGANRKCC